MKILDISWPVFQGMPEYGGRKECTFTSYGKETKISLINHTGTHVDGPAYFFNNAKSIDQFDLSILIGECQVLDLMHVKEKIEEKDLERFKITPGQIILFKTSNSFIADNSPFKENFVYLAPSGAEYLASKKIKSVGIDYLALETTAGFPSHKILLKQEILVIEGLRLKNVQPRTYQLICLPVNLIGIDAAFARAILIDNKI
jgi:arylformamidase